MQGCAHIILAFACIQQINRALESVQGWMAWNLFKGTFMRDAFAGYIWLLLAATWVRQWERVDECLKDHFRVPKVLQ